MREDFARLMLATPYEIAAWVAVLMVLVGIGTFLFIKLQPEKLHGDAQMETRRGVVKAGLLDHKPSNDPSIIVGKWGGKFIRFFGTQFVALLASTQSGKTAGIIIVNLLNWHHSSATLDVKGENHSITSKWRKEVLRHEVYKFAPFEEQSHRWNPLEHIKGLDRIHQVPEVLSVGYTLYPQSESSSGDWNGMARNLFVGLVLMLLETPGATVSLGAVLRLSAGEGDTLQKDLAKIIKERQESDNPLSRRCVDSLRRFIKSATQTAGSILSTFSAPLTLWESPIVDAATETSDFKLSDLRKKLMDVYIVIPVNKLDQSTLLVNLFFSQLLKQNTDVQYGYSPEIKYRVLLVMDELLAIGYLPLMAKGASFIASFGIRIISIAQSRSQIGTPTAQGGYGKEGAAAYLDNHALKIWFTPENLEDAKEYSELIGYKTVKSRTRNRRKPMEGTESDQRRAVRLPQDLLAMSQKLEIIRLKSLRPFECKKIRYYDEDVFVRRLKSVCPELAAIKGNPTFDELKSVLINGGLAAPVPSLVLRDEEPARPITEETPVSGIDFSHLPQITEEPITANEAGAFADLFLATIGIEPEQTA